MTGRSLRVVLLEGGAAGTLEDERRFELLEGLLEGGYAATRTVQDGEGLVAPEDGTPLVALGRLGDGASVEGAVETIDPDAGGAGVDAVLARLNELRDERGQAPGGQWHPWFPVIDYERCTNCMQCLSFCLFDVYSVDEAGQITVRNEEKCKTNCPACSRVCPEVAILFPKYKKGPINGDVVRSADVQSESMKVDISALLGGDIYAALRERSEGARKRFSTERDESKALLERKRCLKALGKQLDVPDEVLMTLPSAGEIEERARRAREKQEKRMARSQSVKDSAPPPAPSEDEWGI